jgi:tyrosine-specific transport protein
MSFENFKAILFPLSVLCGTIIGVGVFGLPYITSKVGFPIMALYFLILGSLVALIHYFFAEISLKTPDLKRFPGFVEFYFGKPLARFAFFFAILGNLLTNLAYLIVGGSFLKELFQPVFNQGESFWVLVYFLLGIIFVFFDISLIKQIEFLGFLGFFLVLFLIFFENFKKINLNYLFPSPDFSQIFLPYGAILFSLWGADLIPEVEEMLGQKKFLLKKIVPLSILISTLVYLFFIYLVLGISGPKTSENSLSGLNEVLGGGIVSLTLIFGILTTFTSFIALSLNLKKIFWYDLKLRKNFAFILSSFPALFLYFLGIKNFISVIGFVGSVMLAINGIFILAMKIKTQNSKRKTQKFRTENLKNRIEKILIFLLIFVLILGIFYEIFYFFKKIL